MKDIYRVVFDVITLFWYREEKAYHKTIRTVFRGTAGPVTQIFGNDYFFGIFKNITMKMIEDATEFLFINGKIERHEGSNNRYYFTPIDTETALQRVHFVSSHLDVLINQFDAYSYH